MRFFILTKQKLAIITFCALAIVITAGISIRGIAAVTASASASKKIPIYYVQKEEKLVSLSFDAAWGNEQTQELLDILDKYNMLDPATQAMFESMLDAAIAAQEKRNGQ